jgi:acyl-coenzyme A thioesterase PaaI-like protein
VRTEARVVVRGRQIITAEARVLDSDGRVLAHGTSTVMVVANKSDGGSPAKSA